MKFTIVCFLATLVLIASRVEGVPVPRYGYAGGYGSSPGFGFGHGNFGAFDVGHAGYWARPVYQGQSDYFSGDYFSGRRYDDGSLEQPRRQSENVGTDGAQPEQPNQSDNVDSDGANKYDNSYVVHAEQRVQPFYFGNNRGYDGLHDAGGFVKVIYVQPGQHGLPGNFGADGAYEAVTSYVTHPGRYGPIGFFGSNRGYGGILNVPQVLYDGQPRQRGQPGKVGADGVNVDEQQDLPDDQVEFVDGVQPGQDDEPGNVGGDDVYEDANDDADQPEQQGQPENDDVKVFYDQGERKLLL